ncbi:glycoside hydrolase family 97 N-terminal domain-containing protein [Hymenobacter sp. BT491]|uniref:glycoside hydrolase family 97 N-terminal domain-containing protein n=1 Tax=Hymenobacter sp. BT491 TaxID=2766779 RepID=UPI001653CB9A|nr:glycoside hydrolase family 97 N-terminal domain-containing protein [Hymenobacter sp. BT491]MBC6990919.1 glycoside hydrolase family 97 N-terminal domain-containing protein [Hymenobacter sp. BT491]
MRLLPLLCLLALPLAAAQAAAQPMRISSPDGAVLVTVAVTVQGQPTYAVHYRQDKLLRPSNLGLQGSTLITDGATNRSFSTLPCAGRTVSVMLPAQGGFVVQP